MPPPAPPPQYAIAADGYPVDPDPDYKMFIGFGANASRYEDWLSKPLPVIDSLLSSDIKDQLKKSGAGTRLAYVSEPIDRSKEKQWLVVGQVPDSQAVHTASDIPLSAFGVGALQFTGVRDNTDVFFKLMRAAFGGY